MDLQHTGRTKQSAVQEPSWCTVASKEQRKNQLSSCFRQQQAS